ncbi:MAG: hypothetical protein PUP91_12540 [Rhizonema sp. PD37]|nr:hypothetical protein [Rhizonema sp. PD37]
MNRPTGVTILAVLELIRSIMGLLVALCLFFFKNAFFNAFNQNSQVQQSIHQLSPETLQIALNVAGGFALFGCLIGFLLTYGLFTLKGWAWIITLVFTVLGILSNISSLFKAQVNPGWTVVDLVINAVIMYYLLQPQVKRAFGR